ncbi:helix-turn-helix domain-containing protein [Streptomyces sp. NBC_00841]|uniref:helix-turn-helix domain-containing protein n=1 Tax=unclassified Streptomyces TaxID=2593676 RepID=UPI0022542EBF|nr:MULTISPECIES: helix-turn-helix domain-containing protein [unclassified Streptomyces]MCX4531512.1 helix-turn-helix domain-containing protein [Streptomyces sp. NBC_01669]WSA02916.1 helix-turn-helix domain-containing protein [Streptomyces sp. NBC_00841]
MLEAIGIGAAEESLYVALLTGPAVGAAELADRTGLPLPEVTAGLAALESRGLMTLHPGRRRALRAAPPDITLNLLVLQHIDHLRKVQLAVAQLARGHQGDDLSGGATETIEVIEGTAAIAERFAQIQRTACETIRALTSGPAVAVPAAANRGQRDAMRAGVRYQVIYERASLDLDSREAPLLLDEWAALGEEMRVAVDVPLKIVIADDRLALVVPREHPRGEPIALVTRIPALLEALGWIFRRIWESAVPVRAVPTTASDGPLSADDRRLLSLLLAGYTDQTIASQLGVSKRTVHRRVQRLLALAGVQTRLQLGWQAARRDWL